MPRKGQKMPLSAVEKIRQAKLIHELAVETRKLLKKSGKTEA